MKAQTKSALLLLATLAVGLLIGAVATGTIVNNRMDQLKALRERGGFAARIEAVIQPQSEAQRQAIHDVLLRSQERFDALRRAYYQNLRAGRDSMRAELDSLLTPDQQARLDAWFARDHRMRRGRRGPEHRRPPGERRPPR